MADKYAEKTPFLDPEAQASEVGSAEQKPARKTFWRQAKALCYVYAAYLLTRALVYSVCLYLEVDDVAGVQTSWATSALSQLRKPRVDTEALYLSVPDPASALLASREYATHPHIAGSIEDYTDATVILKLFQDHFGIVAPPEPPLFPAGSPASRSATLDINKLHKPAAWIDIYYPVMNTPLDRAVEILGADGEVEFSADLVEDGDPRDPEAAEYRDAVPTFHGLSADGIAEGEIVYVNYGRKEDYDEIVAKGGNLTGKIVLARYGANFRGLKILGAEQLGAAGVLIYSDPRDDGAVTVANGYEPYPAGPARNPTAVQRGSVQYLSLYPGDPTTPGAPAYANATRLEGGNIPKIPSLPISWANAQRLLKEISGGEAEAAFVLDGHASEKKVKLVNHVNTRVMPIWNTMAAIPGHIKNETVFIGCHRDAWVMGAADPTSGTVSIHEVVRGFGELLKSGWKPLRNVVFASWDAEEYGLIGSTEWAEDFPEWVSANVVSYINLDVSSSGTVWNAGGSPSLAHLIRAAALAVPHPTDPSKTLWDARKDSGPFEGALDPEFAEMYEAEQHVRAARQGKDEVGIPALGSGSDFTPFLQRLGVASMDQGFGGTPNDAPYHYHSIYDSQLWQERYADPGFVRHVAVAKHLGLVALRLTDSIILPLNTTHYSLELDDYLDSVEAIAASLQADADFTGLRRSIKRLQSASAALDAEKDEAGRKLQELLDKIPLSQDSHASGLLPEWLQRLLKAIFGHARPGPLGRFVKAAKRVQSANAKLVAFERGFIHEEGIEGREWYRHLGVAPGRWLGYGATTLPSITEALTFEGNATLAELEASRVSALLDKLTETIKV
ncbi:Zn-dependent exopeptidase [Trametes versicolor FP-101664 SS1]|uniref:Zn-dependent exopeptidase n=1 Tax=Trametes versicolor (strain FP-101664) TaxID=717944 RepID=UPI0004622C2C|nr:Zn-dependent exopeptidase [Trametes versicolor FP-101664 SS1]EIW61691.1 Zn-dependent exopeptidase [Trametes versicolor FP-101664 SS1]